MTYTNDMKPKKAEKTEWNMNSCRCQWFIPHKTTQRTRPAHGKSHNRLRIKKLISIEFIFDIGFESKLLIKDVKYECN